MKAVIVSDFIGIINDVVIEEKRIYYSIEYILSKIEKKFCQCYNKRFINDLVDQLNYLYLKLEQFDFSKFEIGMNLGVKTFNELKFDYDENDFYGIKEFNNNIFNGVYNL